ncbi:hypothetical protein CPter91_4902 [Collimonas pratensis]|uniref:Uncharacterized protein n=1 Tax=Collimonas pratensis TaxID=279113 RepID=A0A127QB21_9BURK|nr:hypothetical protein CPter91_4902 [Collimonas pratensis]
MSDCNNVFEAAGFTSCDFLLYPVPELRKSYMFLGVKIWKAAGLLTYNVFYTIFYYSKVIRNQSLLSLLLLLR